MESKSAPTDKYKHFNHHHEINDDEEFIEINGEKFIADKPMIPLLFALNTMGLKTRTHSYDAEDGSAWIGIIMDTASIEVRKVFERDSTRFEYDGKQELIISWQAPLGLPHQRYLGGLTPPAELVSLWVKDAPHNPESDPFTYVASKAATWAASLSLHAEPKANG